MARKRESEVELAASEAAIRELKVNKWSFAQISEELGIPESRVFTIYRNALAKSPLSAVQMDEHRLEALETIDVAEYHLMQIATAEKTSARSRIEAWSAIRAWEERRSKLIGLDAPTRHEVLTINSIDAQIAALESELATRAALGGEVIDAELVEDPGGDPAGGHASRAAIDASSPTAGTDSDEGEARLPLLSDEVPTSGRFSEGD